MTDAAPAPAAVVDDVSDELSCSICTGLMVRCVALECTHAFCRACIGAWFANTGKQSCPTCRAVHTGALQPVRIVDNAIERIVQTTYTDEKKRERQALLDEVDAATKAAAAVDAGAVEKKTTRKAKRKADREAETARQREYEERRRVQYAAAAAAEAERERAAQAAAAAVVEAKRAETERRTAAVAAAHEWTLDKAYAAQLVTCPWDRMAFARMIDTGYDHARDDDVLKRIVTFGPTATATPRERAAFERVIAKISAQLPV
jgi:uncharacterized Zn finger protein (UPF0148 family)